MNRSGLLKIVLAAVSLAFCSGVPAQTVVFQQPGFPVVDSEPISHDTLAAAIPGEIRFADIATLRSGEILKDTTLLVLPYGSAFPAEAWPSVQAYLHRGGNLLVIGGQPLRVPVFTDSGGKFTPQDPQDSYARAIGLRHSYAVPLQSSPLDFHWRHGYDFLPALQVHVQKVFAQEGRLQGLGYLDEADGTHAASPIIFMDHPPFGPQPANRMVALPFLPAPGYFSSPDGLRLIHVAASYANAGATNLQIEAKYNTLRSSEAPELTAHLRRTPSTSAGSISVELRQSGKLLEQAELSAAPLAIDIPVPFHKPLPLGTYTVTAIWKPAAAAVPQEFAENGFEVQDFGGLESGEALGVNGDFLTLGGKPFFPVGANYFTTEENGWDLSGPRNAAVWETDFADMERHGVNCVRTGVWMNIAKFIDPATGAANERFLRNLEAFLTAAHRHHIVVNFTFFAFTPRVLEQGRPAPTDPNAVPPRNPYLNQDVLKLEKGYIASIVNRFGKLPWLSYDLINEPSFSNPANTFHGNYPNGDADELAAWQLWLQKRYATLDALAGVWRTTPTELADWHSIPLPKPADLNFGRYGNERQVRAFDYNLFAQDIFAGWVRTLVGVIRDTGSHQLINVGQDEGGVSDRVLNQFYATAGVSFTTNHTYWQDDALLWDSVVAKRPGMPNITGETGYQPAWNADGSWRYDELTGAAIEERKWALGFAAGSSGAMQWDWAREPDFGIQRSDGSAKIWEPMMRKLGDFARQAAPYATGLTLPEVAIILPQSLQFSTRNAESLKAQQTAVRVLYQYNRTEAYAVGEFQIDTLGKPKLILLPSAYGLSGAAWAAIERQVRAGATLLASGPFSADEHLHLTQREKLLGLETTFSPLQLRDEVLKTPVGNLPLHYDGQATTMLDRDTLPNGVNFTERPLGKGKILFSTLPLELNGDLNSIAKVYDFALKSAHINPTYATTTTNPGILICPTRLPHATLYVLTSETESTMVSFTDKRSGRSFSGLLNAGRAALLMVTDHGDLVARYGWQGSK
jgi:hypothetical protein